MVRRLFIGVKAAGKQRQVGAKFERGGGWHGAAHAEFTRRIVSRTDNTALHPTAANGNRDVAQCRVVTHFHRREEAVHINVDDFTHSQTLDCTYIQYSKIRRHLIFLNPLS